MNDKIIKLLNSSSRDDIILGLYLFSQDKSNFEIFNCGQDGDYWVSLDKTPFKSTGRLIAIILENSIIYRTAETLVYAQEGSHFYKILITGNNYDKTDMRDRKTIDGNS